MNPMNKNLNRCPSQASDNNVSSGNPSGASGKSSQPQSGNPWTQNAALKGIDPQKLALLNALAEQGKGKSPQELLPFLMSAASQNQSRGLKFSPQEMDAIIQVLKLGKSPAEIQRMEQMLQMIKLLR